MSLLPVISLVKEYNADRQSCFAYDTHYIISEGDNRKLERIAEMIKLINPPFQTSLQICKHSGQVFIRCTLPKHSDEPCMFPPINQRPTKV